MFETFNTIALISDIHANLEALQVILEDLENHSPDLVVNLGDVVGYGPNPQEVSEIVDQISDISVLGNHDYALYSRDFTHFNYMPRAILEWSRTVMKEETISMISSYPPFSLLPLGEQLGHMLFVHGSPNNPLQDYIDADLPDWAYDIFFQITQEMSSDIKYLVVGHTHQPMQYTHAGKVLLNPGSIGQPRDHDPRASYMILERTPDHPEFKISNIRLEYDVEQTCSKIENLGLPSFMAHRLRKGI